jgi:hypothetical protein
MDNASGFYQIRICAGKCQKTAFSTKSGLYEWMVLQFEPANAPSQFMQCINHLPASNPGLCKFVAIDLDNVFIHSMMNAEHLDHIRIVVDNLQT